MEKHREIGICNVCSKCHFFTTNIPPDPVVIPLVLCIGRSLSGHACGQLMGVVVVACSVANVIVRRSRRACWWSELKVEVGGWRASVTLCDHDS